MPAPALAQDKRSVDHDGRLRVPGCRISKANVCPYYGHEIPGFEVLGLDASRVYMMYRDPEELRKAAATFDSVPLLDVHIPVTADSHEHDATVGTVTNTRFEYPYLVGDVTVWTQDAKDLIETEKQRELSSAYRYTADMTPGTSPEGLRFDGIMRNLMGNHLALVAEGRAGPDVLVADELPKNMRFNKFLTALAKLFPTPPDAAGLVVLDSALSAEIDAMDADMDDDKKKAACDSYAKELGKDAGSLTDEEKTEAYRRAAADGSGPGNSSAPNAAVGGAPKPAQDAVAPVVLDEAAITIKAREGYVEKAAAEKLALDAAAVAAAPVHALYAARDAVADKVGAVNLETLKTAEAVYRYALDKLTVPHADVPAEALAALYTAALRPAAAVTTDATPFNARELIPGLRLISRG